MAHLQECRRLGRLHPPYHRLQQLREHRQDRLARTSEQVDDEIPDEEAARLVLALKLLRNHLQDAVQPGLASRGVRPGDELIDVLADDVCEHNDTVLLPQPHQDRFLRSRRAEGRTWIVSLSSVERRLAYSAGASIAKTPSPSPVFGAP